MELVERRSAPRFDVSLYGTVTTQEGHQSKIQVSNISSSGLQFVVVQQDIPHLLPNDSTDNKLHPVTIQVHLDLADESPLLEIQCGIVYVQRASHVQCNVGCRFEVFAEDSCERLENYISHVCGHASLKLLDNV